MTTPCHLTMQQPLLAAVPHSQDVAALHRSVLDETIVDFLPLSWADIDTEWVEWNRLGHSKPTA